MNIDAKDLHISNIKVSSSQWSNDWSGVRILHIPTRTVVECKSERSQYRNRDKAMEMLEEKLNPKEKVGIHAPEGGWKENTLYECEVSFSKHNPVHKCVFFSGFLNGKNGGPGGYNCAFNPTWENEQPPITKLYYLKPLRELGVTFDVIDER